MMMETIQYKIDRFEGPLDLLLALVEKNKINIDDIPISLLCSQYMEYIAQAQAMDIELSSEFIVMASELMLIKSKMLLPRNEETDEDPRAMLANAIGELLPDQVARIMEGTTVKAVGEAIPALTPSVPNYPSSGLLGGALGILAVLGWILFRVFFPKQ